MSYKKRLASLPPLVVTVMLAGILLIVPASMSTIGIGSTAAFAAGNGYGNSGQGNGNGNNNGQGNGNANNQTSDHGNNNSNDNSNSTGGNQGNSNGQDKGPGDNVSGHGHNADERMQDYVNETAQERHHEHLSMNAPTTGPYTANLNYTLTANGNATAISDSSNLKNATVTLDLSVWKSTSSVVSMDIINGTLKIGDNQTQIYSGHAYYLENKPRMIVYGFVVDNATDSPGNSSSHSVKLVKLFMSANGTLPAASSDPALQISVLSPQSKLASEWFLEMDGQVQRS